MSFSSLYQIKWSLQTTIHNQYQIPDIFSLLYSKKCCWKCSFPYFDPNRAGIIQTVLDTLYKVKTSLCCEGSSIGTKVTTEINLQTKANHRPLIERRRCPSLNNLPETQSTSSKATGASGWLSPTLWAECRAGNELSRIFKFYHYLC